MEAGYALEWLSLLARWAHVVTAMAWIGASFYFIWLDDRLEASSDPKIAGELWAIHGGGFYRAEKFRLGPPVLPATLHWFKWEAYWTWVTGFSLLVLVYYVNAELYLIDPAVLPLSKPAAIAIGVGSLMLGLAVYEALCRSALGRNDAVLSAVLFAALAFAAWGLTKVFSGRGAFIHYGAILGMIMAANVSNVIIPGQQRMVEAVRAGREPDPKYGVIGKQRSVHNTYFTLPVVFAMLANHYAMAFGHRHAWLVLVAMTLAGALIRVWFVMRHKRRAKWWMLAAGLLFMSAAAALMAPKREAAEGKVSLAEAMRVIDARCASCHAQKPVFQGIAEAPKGVLLDTPVRVQAQAARIHQQAVLSRAMPPGNLTGITEEERQLLERWYRHRDRAN
jgi:uncharacterized membrane protein